MDSTTTKRGRGRPPALGPVKRPARITVRLTDEQHDAASRAAVASGLPLAQWATRLIVAASSPKQ